MAEQLLRTKFKDTSEVNVPNKLVSQVIGQEKAVEIAKKAAKQKRNMLLIGEPGTGKSMIAQAMSELLPVTELQDVLSYANQADSNNPLIRVVKAGEGKVILNDEKKKMMQQSLGDLKPGFGVIFIMSMVFALFIWLALWFKLFPDVILAAFIIVGGLFLGLLVFASAFATGMKSFRFGGGEQNTTPKLLIDNSGKTIAPFVDATGARAGALLGDIKHDPYQCIPAGQSVYLDNGQPIKINELLDPFYDDQSEIEKSLPIPIPLYASADTQLEFTNAHALRSYKRRYNDNIISFDTLLGHSFKTTPNHPIAVLRVSSDSIYIDYKRADDMNIGDYVLAPKTTPFLNEKVNEPLELFADILADGHVGINYVGFKFARPFKIKKVKNDITAAGFNFKHSILKYHNIHINSASFVRHLREIGLAVGKNKRVPSCVFNATEDQILHFLSSFISLDGYVGVNGQFEIISSQEDLLRDIQALLLKFGVKAAYRPRLDTGFAKGKLQHRITWGNYDWAKAYYNLTPNPVHVNNLEEYFATAKYNHVAFHDELPILFDYLEKIRKNLGVSKEKIHREYYALNQQVKSSKKLTRQCLSKIIQGLEKNGAKESDLCVIKQIASGNYSFDKVVQIREEPYSGFVYNMTTNTGNYLVNGILTHNSGGLGTPAHLRVEPGMIHRANKGVLFIDEIATLSPKAQQELLTVMQEKKYSITGQSEMSSGAMVRTQPVPCDFLLIASGNMVDLQKMHPALRSRIRGYGYEVYLNEYLNDTLENRELLLQFVAQEIKKDGKIPHFTYDAIEEIIFEARRRAGMRKRLTLKLRDLGGLVRAAGDVAISENAKLVTRQHVLKAKEYAATLEQQLANKFIELKKEYEVFKTTGFATGKVNGLAVLGSGGQGGLLLPIEAEVAPAHAVNQGKIIATGKLGDIAKEAVQNVSAIIKRYKGVSISTYDVHVQFLQTHEGVEGDSASVSVATAVMSAFERIPVKQSVAMTGSLSVKGEVLPVGGITSKVEAAIDAGVTTVIVPASNKDDIFINKQRLSKIKVIPASTLADVLKAALKDSKKKDELIAKIKQGMD